MKTRRIKPPKHEPHSDYHKVWRAVDGAVRDCFRHHPDYLTKKGHRDAQESLVKRVTGGILTVMMAKENGFPETGKGEPGL